MVATRRPRFWWKLNLYNFEQFITNSTGLVYDLSKSDSGSMINTRDVLVDNKYVEFYDPVYIVKVISSLSVNPLTRPFSNLSHTFASI